MPYSHPIHLHPQISPWHQQLFVRRLNEPRNKLKKWWIVLTTQAFHTSCYDGVGFRGEQNSVGVHCKSSLLFSSFLLLILKLSTERWTLWIESYLLNQLTLIYLYDSWLHLYKEKRGTGQRPNRLNQCQKSILHTLFFPFSRLFLFSLNCSNDKMKFLFHFSCLYKPKC